MNLTELKNTPVAQLVHMCEQNGIENVARLSKKEIIFHLLKFGCILLFLTKIFARESLKDV